MKVHLIKRKTIEDFILENANSKISFISWLSILKYADWDQPQDIISTFNTADIIGRGTDRIVFNIGGNNYRLICSYYFGEAKVHLFIKWIGSHSEYTKLCKLEKQFTIDDFK